MSFLHWPNDIEDFGLESQCKDVRRFLEKKINARDGVNWQQQNDAMIWYCTSGQYCIRSWFGTVKQQAITWANQVWGEYRKPVHEYEYEYFT